MTAHCRNSKAPQFNTSPCELTVVSPQSNSALHPVCRLNNAIHAPGMGLIPNASPSTSYSSSSLLSHIADISLKSTHVPHSRFPLYYSKLFHHLSLDNSIQSGLCTSLFPSPLHLPSHTSGRFFEYISQIMSLSCLKFISSSPVSLKESLKLLIMDKRACVIWAN